MDPVTIALALANVLLGLGGIASEMNRREQHGLAVRAWRTWYEAEQSRSYDSVETRLAAQPTAEQLEAELPPGSIWNEQGIPVDMSLFLEELDAAQTNADCPNRIFEHPWGYLHSDLLRGMDRDEIYQWLIEEQGGLDAMVMYNYEDREAISEAAFNVAAQVENYLEQCDERLEVLADRIKEVKRLLNIGQRTWPLKWIRPVPGLRADWPSAQREMERLVEEAAAYFEQALGTYADFHQSEDYRDALEHFNEFRAVRTFEEGLEPSGLL